MLLPACLDVIPVNPIQLIPDIERLDPGPDSLLEYRHGVWVLRSCLGSGFLHLSFMVIEVFIPMP